MHGMMQFTAVTCILFLYILTNNVVECAMCVSHGSCGCRLDNGDGIIDLSPMVAAAGSSPMFVYYFYFCLVMHVKCLRLFLNYLTTEICRKCLCFELLIINLFRHCILL